MYVSSREQAIVVSVIIPVWNGRQYLRACLDALLCQKYAVLEIIVVDNASSDGSADFVATQYPTARLIRARSNLGFAGACNEGLRVAQGNVLVLLNQDTCVDQGWLCALSNAFQQPEVGVAGCKILYPDGRTIQHAGGRIEWPLGIAHHDGQGEEDAGQWDEPRPVEYVTGAALAFRREVLERVGFLDEGFWPGYFEDADFCFRAREAGYEIWYAPQAVLTHAETTSIDDAVTLSRAYQRGRLRFVLKQLPPQRFLDEYVPAEQDYLLGLGSSYSGAVLRTSYLEAISVAASILPRRWQVDAHVLDCVLMALERLARFQSDSLSFAPPLQEFEFRSRLPVIGGLVASVRSLWYGVAARWAMRYLVQQQEVINQQQDAYVRSLVSLSRQVAHLSLEAGRGREAGVGEVRGHE